MANVDPVAALDQQLSDAWDIIYSLKAALDEWAGEKHAETHWLNGWPTPAEDHCDYCAALTPYDIGG